MDQIFFKIHIADLFQSTFGQPWLNPTTLSRDIGDFLFQSTMGKPGMPDHTQEKLRDSYYMQKRNFLPQIAFEILTIKKLCNMIGGEHFQLQLKN